MTSTTMPVLCADRLQTGCACMFIYFKIQRISVKNGDVYMIPGPGPQPIRVIIINFFLFNFFFAVISSYWLPFCKAQGSQRARIVPKLERSGAMWLSCTFKSKVFI